jgi:hypothetical protein
MFFTCSRPCELLNQKSDKDKCGLRWKDLIYVKTGSEDDPIRYWQIFIRHFKNQRHRAVPKEIWLGSSKCAKCKDGRGHCAAFCHYLDPFTLLYWVRRRRKALMRDSRLSLARRMKLSVYDDAKVFVLSTGWELRTHETSFYIKEFVRLCHLLEPKRYSEYSLRVGGTTQAAAAAIPDGYTYAWVDWSPSKLPDAARRYCRPAKEELLKMPYYMLHGFVSTNGQCTIPSDARAQFRDLWAECNYKD